MRAFILLCFAYSFVILVFNQITNSKNETKIVETAIVSGIHDGDTIKVKVTKEYSVRLIDCWAPEITGKEKDQGLKSKAG